MALGSARGVVAVPGPSSATEARVGLVSRIYALPVLQKSPRLGLHMLLERPKALDARPPSQTP
eukprot:2999437-Prymnesium_polylepis.1